MVFRCAVSSAVLAARTDPGSETAFPAGLHMAGIRIIAKVYRCNYIRLSVFLAFFFVRQKCLSPLSLFDWVDPAEFVLDGADLCTINGVIEHLCDFADFAIVDFHNLVFVFQCTDR